MFQPKAALWTIKRQDNENTELRAENTHTHAKSRPKDVCWCKWEKNWVAGKRKTSKLKQNSNCRRHTEYKKVEKTAENQTKQQIPFSLPISRRAYTLYQCVYVISECTPTCVCVCAGSRVNRLQLLRIQVIIIDSPMLPPVRIETWILRTHSAHTHSRTLACKYTFWPLCSYTRTCTKWPHGLVIYSEAYMQALLTVWSVGRATQGMPFALIRQALYKVSRQSAVLQHLTSPI